MRRLLHIFSCFSFLVPLSAVSQTTPFRENAKWGIKENDTVIVAPLYDTVFNFDASGKVCMACFKTVNTSANKFIRTVITSYSCNYLNKAHKRLSLKVEGNDTCSVFTLGKSTVKSYNGHSTFFTVTAKNKKHLVSRDFEQLTFKGYYDIVPAPDANYYIAQIINEGGVVLTGLIDHNEQEIIPFNYSDIKMNRYDSLIVGCSAGIRNNGTDDIFNYSGKKIDAYHRHVDLATKNFIVHKLFEPKEYYIIYNISTKEEKTLNAEGIQPSLHDEILMRVKNDWFIYDLKTNQKKPLKSS